MENERDITTVDLYKEAIMKIDAFMADIRELREEDSINTEDKETLTQMAEYAGIIEATLVNMLRRETGGEDEEYISESFDIEPLYDLFPEIYNEDVDIYDLKISD